MKSWMLITLLVGLLAGCKTATDGSMPSSRDGDSSTESVRFCGKIYRYNENGVTSADNVVKIALTSQQPATEHLMLVASGTSATAALDAIRAPNDIYYGCAYGTALPQQGVEGITFSVTRVTLISQPTGVSVGN